MSASISKVNIEEANSHLRKLHKKVFELENRIQMQALHVEELQKANTQLSQQLGKITRQSALEISELTQRLENSEGRVHQLLEAAQERDTTVLQLEKKAQLFYKVVEHRSAISHILEVLEELSVPDEDDGGGGGKIHMPGGRLVGPGSQNTTGELVINTKGQNSLGNGQDSVGLDTAIATQQVKGHSGGT